MAEGDTLLNAVIGGGITILTASFVPFAPFLGGAIAGYLEGGERSDGLRIGGYAGMVALLPVLVLSVFVSGFLGGVGLGAFLSGIPGGGAAGVLAIVFFVIVFVLGLVYFVGLSAAGGWVGNYVKYETDVDI
jgi:hypothetical protein